MASNRIPLRPLRRWLIRLALGKRSFDYMQQTLAHDPRLRGARFADIVVRKDGRERRIEADWLKTLGKIVLPSAELKAKVQTYEHIGNLSKNRWEAQPAPAPGPWVKKTWDVIYDTGGCAGSERMGSVWAYSQDGAISLAHEYFGTGNEGTDQHLGVRLSQYQRPQPADPDEPNPPSAMARSDGDGGPYAEAIPLTFNERERP